MAGYDALLWRALHRVLAVLAIGVLGLQLALGVPDRSDSLLGLLLVVLVALPVGDAVRRMPAQARANLRLVPRFRPLMTATAGACALVCLLVLCWALGNAISPGMLSLLTLALVGVVVGALLALAGRISRSLRR